MKRNVIFICNNTQSRHNFNDVEVNTLRDVKILLDNEGINYTDQAFYEGVSKAEYDSDDSVMPSNLPFKGKITNDLVFLLSNKNKKIASGAGRSRQECYSIIKTRGLSNEIKKTTGLLYTSIKTDTLNEIIDRHFKDGVDNIVDIDNVVDTNREYNKDNFVKDVISAISKLGYIVCTRKVEQTFSDDDINDMFAGKM